jgi:VanZ family protein
MMEFRRYFTWPNCSLAAAIFLALVATLLPHPPRIPVEESAAHLILAFSIALAASMVTRHPTRSAIAAFALLTVTEFLQIWIPGRGFSIDDIMWNGIGALIAVPIVIGVMHVRRQSLAV